MHEFKAGTLKSGSGQKVTNPKQAVAIGLSEERRKGDRRQEGPKEPAVEPKVGPSGLVKKAGKKRAKSNPFYASMKKSGMLD